MYPLACPASRGLHKVLTLREISWFNVEAFDCAGGQKWKRHPIGMPFQSAKDDGKNAALVPARAAAGTAAGSGMVAATASAARSATVSAPTASSARAAMVSAPSASTA